MTSSMPCHGPNNRRHSTYEPAQPAELPPWALFAHKMPPNFWEAGHGLIRVGSAFFIASNPISLGARMLPIILSMYTSRAWRCISANGPVLHPFAEDCPACSARSLKETGMVVARDGIDRRRRPFQGCLPILLSGLEST